MAAPSAGSPSVLPGALARAAAESPRVTNHAAAPATTLTETSAATTQLHAEGIRGRNASSSESSGNV